MTIIKKIKDKKVNFEFNKEYIKVVTDKNNFAMYFSRSKIPFLRNIDKIDFLVIYKVFST